MSKIETAKHNSTILNPDWLKDSGLTPTVWEQAQLSQDLVQSLDGSNNAVSLNLEQFDSLTNQFSNTPSFPSATKADTKNSKTISRRVIIFGSFISPENNHSHRD